MIKPTTPPHALPLPSSLGDPSDCLSSGVPATPHDDAPQAGEPAQRDDNWAGKMWAFLNHVDAQSVDEIVKGFMHSTIDGCIPNESHRYFIAHGLGQTVKGLLARAMAAEASLAEVTRSAAIAAEPVAAYPLPFRVEGGCIKDANGGYVAELSSPHGGEARDAVAKFIVAQANAAPTTSPEPDAMREAYVGLKVALRDLVSLVSTDMHYDDSESLRSARNILFDLNKTDPVLAALSRPAHGGWKDIIEQCAKVADEMTRKWGNPNGSVYAQGMQDQGIRIAAQIRALSRNDRDTGGPRS